MQALVLHVTAMRTSVLIVQLACACPVLAAGPALPDASDEGDGAAHPMMSQAIPAGQVARARLRLQSTTTRVRDLRLQQSIVLRHDMWTIAALAERDAGERSWHDHTAIHARRDSRRLELVAGHMRPVFGQGLLFGRGRSGSTPSPVARRRDGALGYHSTAEAHAIAGVAGRAHLGAPRRLRVTIAALAGALTWDARVDEGTAVTLLEDGDHSGSARATRGRLRGTALGARLRVSTTGRSLGVSLQRLAFQRPVDLRRDDTPYEFSGRQQWSGVADGQWLLAGAHWSLAVAQAGARCAGVVAVSRLLVAGLRLDVLGRRYARGYFSPLGSAPTGGDMDGEAGLTIQLASRSAGTSWRAWLDATHRTAPRWRQPLPGRRRGGGLHFGWRWASWRLSVDGQQRQRHLRTAGLPVAERTRRARLQAQHQQGRMRTTVRVDAAAWQPLHHNQPAGQVLSPDAQLGTAGSVALRWRGDTLRVDGLLSRFSTQGYGARIYQYEPQVPGAVSIRPQYGEGMRLAGVVTLVRPDWMLALRWRLSRASVGVDRSLTLQIDRTLQGERRRQAGPFR